MNEREYPQEHEQDEEERTEAGSGDLDEEAVESGKEKLDQAGH